MLRLLASLVALSLVLPSCGKHGRGPELSNQSTFAELRTIKGSLMVTAPGEARRAPFPRERLVEGQGVEVPAGGLAWMRRDGGATWLISGPATLTVREKSLRLERGRAFVDGELGDPVLLETPRGTVELADARASIEVSADGEASVYVLRGSARSGDAPRAVAGELMRVQGPGKVARKAMVSWEDWTGGLGSAERVAEPAPFGIGTVGARKPGDQGKPRFSLVIQRLDVKVTIDQDFASTEVDQTFVNPSSDTVEGIFAFRTPPRAVLSRFGVDRNGDLVWGRVKESAAAAQQYQSNVYQGSEEDPALLSYGGAGIYNARLYPIRQGTTRRVVTRYTEWLSRQGPRGERRLYVYPMAAEGARGSLPRIEELTITLDLSRAGASSVRAGMGGVREGDRVVVKAFDFVPRADLSVELFDQGQLDPVAYRAPHVLTADDLPHDATADFARKVAREEPDYLAVPLRAPALPAAAEEGLDLAIVVDSSAATEPSALALSRSLAASLLAHVGPRDRVALWAGDASLRPVADGSGALAVVDAEKRKAWLSGLAGVERGGATDIGVLLTEAASRLDPKRRGSVVYIGDGAPTVGELAPKSLRDRLARLPAGTRVLTAAVGSQPNVALLESLSRGGAVEQVHDAFGAARSALRLLEAAGRPVWLGAEVDLGPAVERLQPRELPPISSDETTVVVGRVIGQLPTELVLRGSGGTTTRRVAVRRLDDTGDLRKRWGEGRLNELIAEGAGRAALVDVARRFGLVSPFTSLYVPTRREAQESGEAPGQVSARERRLKLLRWKPWSLTDGMFAKSSHGFHPVPTSYEQSVATTPLSLDDEEGGTGTRAKGEEGAMSKPAPARRYAVQGPRDNPDVMSLEAEPVAPAPQMETAPAAPPPPAAARPPAAGAASAGNLWGDDLGDKFGAGGLGLQGVGRGGGGAPRLKRAGGLAATGEKGKDEAELRAELQAANREPAAAATKKRGSTRESARVEEPSEPAPPESKPAPSESPLRPPSARGLGQIGHERRPCGRAADLPFLERQILWRERLLRAGSVDAALEVYRAALLDCEASDWRERAMLLVFMVDRLESIRDRVALFRGLLAVSPVAADAVYRFLLLRIQTASDLKELHEALGFERMAPELLEALLKKARSPAERLSLLRGASDRFPEDTELALTVLEAYEDAGDDAGGRAFARRLRRRVDATAHVRTNVGEYYLRLAARQSSPARERDAEEARRTFGELVEFAPEDPLARRRLGDLLRAHGWYEEALRQYQTLAELTPDDPSVPLLLAAAAQGTGKIEEAVRWAEKAAGSGSPDGSSPVALAARALSSAFLSWARADSLREGKKDEAERLRARAARLAADSTSAGVRVVLTWAHPELRPALWTHATGAPLPAPDNLPLLGVAQAIVPASPAPVIELRLDPEDAARAARLGARAVVTAIAAEGSAEERLSRLEVSFRDEAGKPRDRVVLRFEQSGLVHEAGLLAEAGR